LSLSYLGWQGFDQFFGCSLEVETHPEYCEQWRAFREGDPHLYKLHRDIPTDVTGPRGSASSQLDLYFLLRRMTEPVAVGVHNAPERLDVEAEISRYFNTYYPGASAAMRAVYDRLAALPSSASVPCAPGIQGGSHTWAVCKWSGRVSRSAVLAVKANLDVAAAAIGTDKRFRAFMRNVWCLYVRGYYEYDDEAGPDRENDTFNVAAVCAEDDTLARVIDSTGNRRLLE
jgi:hypothetical protein